MYNKLFTKILDSSLWLEPAHVRLVWITMLAMQDRDGMVALSSVGNVALRARVSNEEAADAVARLEAPDPHNPGQEHDGRRVERVPGTGWIILNAEKYRALVTAEEARRLNRERVQRHREKVKAGGSCNGGVMEADAEAEKQLPPERGGEGEGFGLATKEQPATDFDITQTRHLEKAVRKLPPRKTGIASCKPSTWVNHFRLLRVKDGVPEKDIARVVAWYHDHIGEEYVPEAYSGESFRKKFPKLEAASKRDKTTTVEIGLQAAAIAARCAGLGWPKGSAKALPGAAQACLDAYGQWNNRRIAFTKTLPPGPLLSFAKHLTNKLPAPNHFVEQWLRDVHDRVKKWEAWGGDLNSFIFKPDAKRFSAMGRGWAMAFCNDADRWDKFVAAMEEE